jgi:Ca-activated chloride channel homolog
MKTRNNGKDRRGRERGSILVFASIALFAIFGFATIAIDVGGILTAKNELQSAVDASALAAASGLTFNQSVAVQRGVELSGRNQVSKRPLALQSSEISVLDATTVRVAAQRPVNLYFARILGLRTATISASAKARLGNRDIMFIFDRSGTMDDDTVDPKFPQPITETKNAAKTFVDLIAGNAIVSDRVGLVSYSTNAQMNLGLCRDFALVKTRVQSFTADGYTNIGQAIQYANNQLLQNAQSRTFKTEILLSDGMANRPGSGMPTNSTAIAFATSNAQTAASNSIKIYTISLGNQTDWNLMNTIAAMTNGKHYHAPTASDLNAIFNEIANHIPTILVD